jgi:hypothetical protein
LLGLEVVVRAEDEGYQVRLFDPMRGRTIPTGMELAEHAAEMEARLRELEAELRRREESAE